MQRTEQFEFTVESYNTNPLGRPQQTESQCVTAATPEAAAAKVLQEQLFRIGNVERLRATVWRLDAAGQRVETKLYFKG
ncbi:hypothetical protein ABIB57_001848 [Devosia sp. UYZn731]|uniref:hypothetical protein n=1 Tax=unclassified Devosia TaxID=196773 RepID=UPI00260C55D4|nr:hypothetical protein [Devosia sp.]MDB5535728.1 hypothetical protein [Devosia sp.]MDB5588395.1 hypothetical protein [Devosia sp.]